jgi:hypothetical protein
MTTISPHVTRGTGTILTAAIYNTDHGNHITNANALNDDKIERAGVVAPGNFAVWVDDDFLEDGGTPGTMAFEDAADFALVGSANTFAADQTIESTDAGATRGPLLKLRRNSASPANDDFIGAIPAIGRNTTPADIEFATLVAQIINAAPGSEAGEWQFHTMVAGALAQRMRLRQGLRLGSPTGGDMGQGTLNATELYKNGVRAWTTVPKAADEARTNNTLADDTDLLFAMLANTKYVVRIRAWWGTAATPDFKYATAGPASPTLVRSMRKHIDPSALTTLASASSAAYIGSTAVNAGTGTTGGYVEIDTIIHNGANAGNFSFQWAQNTTDASATTLLAGSYLEYRQL